MAAPHSPDTLDYSRAGAPYTFLLGKSPTTTLNYSRANDPYPGIAGSPTPTLLSAAASMATGAVVSASAVLSATTSLSVGGQPTVKVTLAAQATLTPSTPVTASAVLASTASMLAAITTLYFPSSDVSIGGWTTDQGLTTNLYSRVSEPIPDDTTYDQSSPLSSSVDPLTLGFAPLSFPPGQNLFIHVRYSKDQVGETDDLLVELLQSGVPIQSWPLYDVPAGWQQFDAMITSQITNSAALSLRFTARVMSATLQATTSLSSLPNLVAFPFAAASLSTAVKIQAGALAVDQATLTCVAGTGARATASGSALLAATGRTGAGLLASSSATLVTGVRISASGAAAATASLSTTAAPYVILDPLVIF